MRAGTPWAVSKSRASPSAVAAKLAATATRTWALPDPSRGPQPPEASTAIKAMARSPGIRRRRSKIMSGSSGAPGSEARRGRLLARSSDGSKFSNGRSRGQEE